MGFTRVLAQEVGIYGIAANCICSGIILTDMGRVNLGDIPFIVYALHDKRGKSTGMKMVHIKLHNAPDGHFFMHPRARPTHHIVPDMDVAKSQK